MRIQIALTGRVNAGKSTLLNLISGQEHAITSAERGTTTDIVEKELFFMNNREKSVRNAASALQEIAGEEGGLMQVRVGGLLGNNKKNTAKMVEYLEGLGYKAVAIE